MTIYTYIGLGGNDLWSNDNNWVENAPTSVNTFSNDSIIIGSFTVDYDSGVGSLPCAISNNGTINIIITAGTVITWSGQVSSSGTLNVNMNVTLILTNNNTISGTINNSGEIRLECPGVAAVNTLLGTISGIGSLYIEPLVTLILTNNNTIPGTINNSGEIRFQSPDGVANSNTLSGTISGEGSFLVDINTILILSNSNNTINGVLNINGTLRAGNITVFSTSVINVNYQGNLDMNGYDISNTLNLRSGILLNNSTPANYKGIIVLSIDPASPSKNLTISCNNEIKIDGTIGFSTQSVILEITGYGIFNFQNANLSAIKTIGTINNLLLINNNPLILYSLSSNSFIDIECNSSVTIESTSVITSNIDNIYIKTDHLSIIKARHVLLLHQVIIGMF